MVNRLMARPSAHKEAESPSANKEVAPPLARKAARRLGNKAVEPPLAGKRAGSLLESRLPHPARTGVLGPLLHPNESAAGRNSFLRAKEHAGSPLRLSDALPPSRRTTCCSLRDYTRSIPRPILIDACRELGLQRLDVIHGHQKEPLWKC